MPELSNPLVDMEIYQVHTRLFMMMEVNNNFSFEAKRELDAENSTVQQWEQLMDKFQQQLPFAKNEEKWVLMDKIFKL
ncbi:MAG: L-rhamnose mutarotase [Cyclobacteriaceae bacterium]